MGGTGEHDCLADECLLGKMENVSIFYLSEMTSWVFSLNVSFHATPAIQYFVILIALAVAHKPPHNVFVSL